MTQEQYERAESAQKEIRRHKLALQGFESNKPCVNITYYQDESITPITVAFFDGGLYDVIKDYLNSRIAELEKEFEEL